MSLESGGLGMLLIGALFLYIIIYYAVKHAIITAHKELNQGKESVEDDVKEELDENHES